MTNPSPRAGSSPPAVKRLLERSRPRTIDVPEVRDTLRKFQIACGEVISGTTGLNLEISLAELRQDAGPAALKRPPGAVDIAALVPQWSAHAIVRLDRVILFRALDSMFGGDPVAPRPAPERALTALEQSVAATLARAMLARLLVVLAVSGIGPVHVTESADSLNPEAVRSDYVVARYQAVEGGDGVAFVMPAAVFGGICDRASAVEQQQSSIVDPGWAHDFRRTVAATRIALRATMEGPQMLLSALARLQPGALIEFDADAMRSVVLVSGEKSVFVGRLGQTRGMFTVLLDRPAKAPGTDEVAE